MLSPGCPLLSEGFLSWGIIGDGAFKPIIIMGWAALPAVTWRPRVHVADEVGDVSP